MEVNMDECPKCNPHYATFAGKLTETMQNKCTPGHHAAVAMTSHL